MAGTDWGPYNLPAIWQILQGENVCAGADRVLAWDGLATSVQEQHQRLVKAGESLAAVWSPKGNASAAVFLGRIDELAASMQETLHCAEDTRAGLRGTIEAIGDAQTTVRELTASRAEISDDWVPRFIDHAEDEYDQKAQQAMSTAEAAIADHSTQITVPTLYTMGAGVSDSTTSIPPIEGGSPTGGSGTAAVRAMPVSVPIPHDPVLPDAGPNPAGSSIGGGPTTPGSGLDPSLGIGPGLSGVTAPLPAGAPGPGATIGLPAGSGPGSGGMSGGTGPLGLIPGALGAGGVGGLGAGFGVPGGMTKAIDFAIAQHAGVINMSFSRPDDQTMHDAIRKAQAADIVLVAGSGNRDDPGDYPGTYPEVLTVGAYDKEGKIASFSITGPQVDLTAPGDQIVTTGIGDSGYDLANGTSEATAVVSGAAALLRAEYPTMSAAEVVHRLTATTDDAGSLGRDDTYGYGRLNIVKALTADVAPLPAASVPTGAANDQAAAPAGASAIENSDLPQAAGPLLPAVFVAGFVLLAGVTLAVIMARRRRRGA